MLMTVLAATAAALTPGQDFHFEGAWAVYPYGADIEKVSPERGCDNPVLIEKGPGDLIYGPGEYAAYKLHEVYGIKTHGSFNKLFISYNNYEDALLWITPGQNRNARISLAGANRFETRVSNGKRTSYNSSKIYVRCETK